MGIQHRLAEVISKSGLSLPEFARKVGVARNSLVRYRDGDISPSFDFLEEVCRKFNIDPVWLFVGEREPRPAVDAQILAGVIAGVRGALKEKNLELHADKEAELIALLYEYFYKGDEQVNNETIQRFLRLVE